MLEHLDYNEASLFLREAKRLLRPGGIIRLCVPDLRIIVQQYLDTKVADIFVANTLLCKTRPIKILEKLRFLIVGNRNHQWLYDGKSLCRLLLKNGFVNPQILKGGESMITDPEPLDLKERLSGSVYVEAKHP